MKIKISAAQTVMLLILCRMFYTVTYSPGLGNEFEGTAILLADFISVFVTLLLLIPLLIFMKKETHADLLSESLGISGLFGKLVGGYFLILLFIVLIDTVSIFKNFMTNAIFPNASAWIIILTFIGACAYGAYLGIEGLARAASIIFILFIISVGMIFFTTTQNIDWINIKPLVRTPMKTLLLTIVDDVSKNVEFILLILLYPRVKGKFIKISMGYVLLSAVGFLFIGGLCVLVLGDFMTKQVFPYYTVASIAQSRVLQRLDAVHMTLWVLISYVKVTAYLIISSELLGKFVPYQAKKYMLLPVSVITAGGALFMHWKTGMMSVLTQVMQTAIPFVIAIVIIPIILLIGRRKKL